MQRAQVCLSRATCPYMYAHILCLLQIPLVTLTQNLSGAAGAVAAALAATADAETTVEGGTGYSLAPSIPCSLANLNLNPNPNHSSPLILTQLPQLLYPCSHFHCQTQRLLLTLTLTLKR